MDLLITGAAGFLGSHFLLEWMRQYPSCQVLCLVRENTKESPQERINIALATAAYECDVEIQPDELVSRITVINANLNNTEWCDNPLFRQWIQRSSGFEIVHGAANLSFREEDRGLVWQTNVTGTSNFFRSFVGIKNIRNFNYISTAYVAGNKEGVIYENHNDRPALFNNVYEESKWAAELIVREIGLEMNVGIKIFRPSIVIGHSRTYRISTKTGFYKVLETLLQLKHLGLANSPVIEIPAKRFASVNLIPVDLVALEMIDVIKMGAQGEGGVFHVTNARPVSIADLFFAVSPLVGIVLACGTHECVTEQNKISALVRRGLRQYLPYFAYVRTFERKNVNACGAGQHQLDYWLDLTRLREFVHAFIESESHKAAQVIKVHA